MESDPGGGGRVPTSLSGVSLGKGFSSSASPQCIRPRHELYCRSGENTLPLIKLFVVISGVKSTHIQILEFKKYQLNLFTQVSKTYLKYKSIK